MTNSYTGSNLLPLSALPTTNGVVQTFLAGITNTGPATYAPDSLAAALIFGFGGQQLQGNEIVTNGIVTLISYVGPLLNSGALCWMLFHCAGGALQVANATHSQQAVPLGQADSRYSPIPWGAISGLTMSTAGSSTTMTIAAGQATDNSNIAVMTLSATITKTTGAWAVGSGNGGLDAGTIAANTWYHFFLIKRTDTGVVDVLISLSSSGPTLPVSYTLCRRFGSMKTNSASQWASFIQDADQFQWTTPAADVAVTLNTTAAVLRTLSVPSGIRILANIMVSNSATSTNSSFYFSDPLTDDIVPSIQFGQVATPSNTTYSLSQITVRTNTSSQIRSRSNFGDTATQMIITTLGWFDARGKD